MASLVVPNGGQLRLHWVMGTELAFNVLGLRIGSGAVVDLAVANALGDAVSSAFNTATLSINLDSGTVLQGVGVRDLRQANLPEIMSSTFVEKVGTGGGSRSSYLNSLCVTLRTAKAGKSFRGRVYLPLDASGAVNEEIGEYLTGPVDNGRNFIQMLRQAIAASAPLAGNFSLAVVSRKEGVEQATPVTSEVVRSPIITTQKRRMPRRG